MIPASLRDKLLANGRKTAAGNTNDPYPVVKVFTPDAYATWLLTEIDPHEPGRAFGLCDLGVGAPELCYVSLSELVTVRGPSLCLSNSIGTSLRGSLFLNTRRMPAFSGGS